MKLPKNKVTIGNAGDVQTVFTKQEAHDTVDYLITRNAELEEINECLQPLLYTISVAVYGEDAAPVSLSKLVEDACAMINGRVGEQLQ